MNLINIKHDHILSCILEGIIECLFILTSLSDTICNEAISITEKDQDSTIVGSIKWCNICDRVGIHKDHRELRWIESILSSGFKESFRTWRFKCIEFTLSFIHYTLTSNLLCTSLLMLIILYLFPIVFKVLSSSEFLKHNHFIFPHLRSDLKELIFLFFLSEIDDVCPSLFILCFEFLEEIIESFILLREFSDACIKWFTLLGFLILDEWLNFLNFRNSSWSREISWFSTIFGLLILKE